VTCRQGPLIRVFNPLELDATGMGRRADPPEVQRAKGNPGRRKSAVAKREEEIARIADILASAPADPADPNAPPALIDRGPMFAAAIAVWKMMAPRLSGTLRLQQQHRPIFAMFCVYYAEWVLANEDIIRHGTTQSVKTVSGVQMERIRPIVKIRDAAFDQVLKLSARFGLTPTDEYDLFRAQQIAAAVNPTLFGGEGPRQKELDEAESKPSGSLVGRLKTMDSAPPQRPN
jgi:P27 family predicted phage terminase small subunit